MSTICKEAKELQPTIRNAEAEAVTAKLRSEIREGEFAQLRKTQNRKGEDLASRFRLCGFGFVA